LGKLTVTGLDEGTYYLTETQAPDGFNKPNAPVDFVLKDSNNTGALDGADSTSYTDGYLPKTVQNSKGFTLPTTGGMGTILFTAGGILLMGAAIVLVVVIRKRKTAAEK
jgi:LPXTG-motif cell wall-anchored protein